MKSCRSPILGIKQTKEYSVLKRLLLFAVKTVNSVDILILIPPFNV